MWHRQHCRHKWKSRKMPPGAGFLFWVCRFGRLVILLMAIDILFIGFEEYTLWLTRPFFL